MIIKYDEDGYVEWAQSIGGSNDDEITTVVGTSDGGYIVGRYFSSSITVGKYILENAGSDDGMIIKYDEDGYVEWAQSIGGSDEDQITTVAETGDGGYLVGGNFYSDSINFENGISLTNDLGKTNGMVAKYNNNGEIEWIKRIGNEKVYAEIKDIITTKDDGYLVGGSFGGIDYNTEFDLGNGIIINETYPCYSDGLLIKYNKDREVQWAKAIGGIGYDRI